MLRMGSSMFLMNDFLSFIFLGYLFGSFMGLMIESKLLIIEEVKRDVSRLKKFKKFKKRKYLKVR